MNLTNSTNTTDVDAKYLTMVFNILTLLFVCLLARDMLCCRKNTSAMPAPGRLPTETPAQQCEMLGDDVMPTISTNNTQIFRPKTNKASEENQANTPEVDDHALTKNTKQHTQTKC